MRINKTIAKKSKKQVCCKQKEFSDSEMLKIAMQCCPHDYIRVLNVINRNHSVFLDTGGLIPKITARREYFKAEDMLYHYVTNYGYRDEQTACLISSLEEHLKTLTEFLIDDFLNRESVFVPSVVAEEYARKEDQYLTLFYLKHSSAEFIDKMSLRERTIWLLGGMRYSMKTRIDEQKYRSKAYEEDPLTLDLKRVMDTNTGFENLSDADKTIVSLAVEYASITGENTLILSTDRELRESILTLKRTLLKKPSMIDLSEYGMLERANVGACRVRWKYRGYCPSFFCGHGDILEGLRETEDL